MGEAVVILGNGGVKRIAFAALALLTCFQGAAWAHQSSTSYSRVVFGSEGVVDVTVTLSSRDLFEALGLAENRDATDAEIVAGADRLTRYVAARVRVFAGGQACPQEGTGVSLVAASERFAAVGLRARCPDRARPFSLRYDLFFDLDPMHVGWAEISAGHRALTHEFTNAARRFELAGDLSGTGFFGFVGHGLDHIFTGYDHLAFVLALLLLAPLFRPRRGALHVLGVVSAFTLAHSITLVLAGLDVVAAPARIVEPAIAASIVFVALENFWFARAHAETPRARWPIAFGFGLVHGLGFAAMLRPLLPPAGIVVPLVAFNVGVELGQLAVVAVALPILFLLRRALGERYRTFLHAGSVMVACAGLFWLVERLLG
jgi:hypothetical protein